MTSLRISAIAALVVPPALSAAQSSAAIPIRTLADQTFRTASAVGYPQGVKHLPDGRVLVNLPGQRRLLAFDSTLTSVSTRSAQEVPIRQLAPVVYRTAEPVGTMRGVRQLPDGRVLANLYTQRRLVLFDTTLATHEALIDSVSGMATSYPRTGYPLLRYSGDTTLFVDGDSRSLIVIEPTGVIGRVMAPPKVSDLTIMATGGSFNGLNSGPDPRGRVIYRGVIPRAFILPTAAGPPVAGQTQIATLSIAPDTTPIVRVDFDTRAVDTLVHIKVAQAQPLPRSSQGADGKWYSYRTINPLLPAVDDWAVLSDGSVAIVRGSDYHIDWIRPDGRLESTPKLPFDWRRLTDADKQGKIDSAKHVIDSLTAAGSPPYLGFRLQPGASPLDISRGAAVPRDTIWPVIEFVPLDSMPDYIPPIRAGAAKADEDGNLWILPTTSSQARGGLLYDVVNRDGVLVERVQLPAGRDIAGFGRGGVVFLSWLEAPARIWLERARVERGGPVSSSR